MREAMIGWRRTAAPAAVAMLVVTRDVGVTLFVLLFLTTWYAAWAYAELWIDPRFGVLLGYAPWRRRPLRMHYADITGPIPDPLKGSLVPAVGPRPPIRRWASTITLPQPRKAKEPA